MDDLGVYLAGRLKSVRRYQKKSRSDVASALGKSVAWVSLGEQGRRQLYVRDLLPWCAYLGIDPGELLNQVRDDDPTLN